MIAIDPNTPFDYIVEAERGSEKPTVFLLKPATERELREMESGIKVNSRTGEFSLDQRQNEYLLLRIGLKGWRDFADADGNPVEFEVDNQGRPSQSSLDRIPAWARTELANAIHAGNRFTEADAGN